MNFFTRLSNGWQIAINSLKVLKANRQLIIFPILSGISFVLILTSFLVGMFAVAGWDADNIKEIGKAGSYALMFVFYILNYFVVVFFNTALIHCTSLYFKGEEVTIRKGLDFSMSRIGAIFAWAVLAGTIGAILKLIQENAGFIGKIITGIIGMVWGVATFFVVPVIAYENLGPVAAVKRSSQIMKEKWGESIGASFGIGIIQLAAMLIVIVPAVLIGIFIYPLAGIVLGILGVMSVLAIFSAAQTIFVSAVYHNVTGDPVELFTQNFVDNLFEKK